MKRAEIAKLESYKEQRDFEISGRNTNNFNNFIETVIHGNNEKHIKILELADASPGSCLDANPGTARLSDDFCV